MYRYFFKWCPILDRMPWERSPRIRQANPLFDYAPVAGTSFSSFPSIQKKTTNDCRHAIPLLRWPALFHVTWRQRQPIRTEHRLDCRRRMRIASLCANFGFSSLTLENFSSTLFLLIGGPEKDHLPVSSRIDFKSWPISLINDETDYRAWHCLTLPMAGLADATIHIVHDGTMVVWSLFTSGPQESK